MLLLAELLLRKSAQKLCIAIVGQGFLVCLKVCGAHRTMLRDFKSPKENSKVFLDFISLDANGNSMLKKPDAVAEFNTQKEQIKSVFFTRG